MNIRKVSKPQATGRPKKFEASSKVLVMLPAPTIAALDAWVEELRASTPGGSAISRSDLIRDLLAKAVAGRGKKGRR